MPAFKKHYDYIVIGAGSGGLLTAIGLQKLGKDVLMVGKVIGGECTHTGCVPSKTFLSLAMHYVMKSQKQCNVELRQGIFARIRDKVREIERNDKQTVASSNLPFIHGEARFLNEATVEVWDYAQEKHHRMSFDTCVIATGSHAQVVPIEGLPEKQIITNDTLFKLSELPERIVIFGGGPIGTEIGTAMAKFCTKTTIIVRSEMIPYEPRECVSEVKKSLQEEYAATIYENIKKTVYDTKTKKLVLMDGAGVKVAEVPEADYYFMALGRVPNTQGLDLENAGIEYDTDGILVDANLTTSNRKVYAIGDVIQGPKFTHLAANQARFILKRVLVPFAKRRESPLPACTYSDPPIASVGCKEESERIKKFIIDFSQTDRGKVEGATGLTGVIFVDMPTGKIVGASMVGHFAENAINFFTLAITKRVSVFELENFMVPYPTLMSGVEDVYYRFLADYRINWRRYIGERIVSTMLRVLPWVSLGGIGLFFVWGIL